MQRSFILHMFTPSRQMSPFDVNMAVDAGYNVVVPYTSVGLEKDSATIDGLTQDAIFSRGPKGVAATGIFIGGRDVVMAADMLEAARRAMVPPFEVSVFADPSGSYTTATAMLGSVEYQLRKAHGTDLKGKTVLILGGTGAVGRIAGVLAAEAGARVLLASHAGVARAQAMADATNLRFGCKLEGVGGESSAAVEAALAGADVVLGTAAAGVQVVSAAQLPAAKRLLVAADVNAVPPEGIAGVGVYDDGKALAGTNAVGIGALAIGNIKYQTQHRLFVKMRNAKKPVYLGYAQAMEMAREVVAELP
jgi:methylene-tetrahydromethanopterin dehydrogenase